MNRTGAYSLNNLCNLYPQYGIYPHTRYGPQMPSFKMGQKCTFLPKILDINQPRFAIFEIDAPISVIALHQVRQMRLGKINAKYYKQHRFLKRCQPKPISFCCCIRLRLRCFVIAHMCGISIPYIIDMESIYWKRSRI